MICVHVLCISSVRNSLLTIVFSIQSINHPIFTGQPLSTASDEDVGLAPVRGSAISTASSTAAARTTTARRAPIRSSTVASTDTEEDTTTSAVRTPITSASSTTSSSTTRLAPVRTTASSSPSTSLSAGRSSSSSPSSTQPSSTAGIGDSTSANDSNVGSDTGSKTNGGAIAGAIIAVLAVLLIAAFFGWRYWKKKKNAKLTSGDGGDTFYPYGSAGGLSSSAAAAGNDKNGNNGYNERINSFEDLASNAAAANDAGNTEKYGQNGYGTMGGGHENEKVFGGGAAAGFGAMNRQKSAEEENFAGRGLSPYNSFNSFSHLPNNGLQGLNNNNGIINNGSPQFGNNNDSYPPTPQQQAHYSHQGSIFNNVAPGAVMMGPPNGYNNNNGFNNDHLPQHQDRALGNAMDAYGSQNGFNNGAIAGAAAGAGALVGAAAVGATNNDGQQQQQGPFADPSTEGKIYIVTRIFEPSMPDELVIYPGDKIQIVVTYDDGWCLGCNLTTAEREGNGTAPARGVFPRDCVEEWTPELDRMMNGQEEGNGLTTPLMEEAAAGANEQQERPTSTSSDIPLNTNETTDLQRAPTLPPLNIGDNSRFSMTSANNNNKRNSHISNNNRPTSLIPGNIPLPASIKSPLSATAIPLPEEESEEEQDIYGGVSMVSPVSKTFPPDIQVDSKNNNDDNNNNNQTSSKRESVPQFGSSYHIADYASRLGDDDEQQQQQQQQQGDNQALNNKRLSTLNEETPSSVNEEFPSTPRTMSATTSTSPRFSGVPPLSSTTAAFLRSPGSNVNNNNGRLSVVDVNHNRLSVGSNLMPSSQSVKSLKRTSSLIASEDAKTFLA